MVVLTKEQTTAAVRALVFFGLRNPMEKFDFGDCSARCESSKTVVSAPNPDKDAPVDQQVTVTFYEAKRGTKALPGRLTVTTTVRWPNEREMQRIGSPDYRIIDQPRVQSSGTSRDFLAAFSRLIGHHAAALKAFNGLTDAA